LRCHVVKDTVDPDHPLVDLVAFVMLAKKMAHNHTAAIVTEWQGTDDAGSRCRQFWVLATSYPVGKQLSTVGAEVVFCFCLVATPGTHHVIIVVRRHV
jgi:hypothetical protein